MGVAPKVAIVVAVFNEEKHIVELLDSLLNQTHMPDSIVLVDDGSTDKTGEIIKSYSEKNSLIKYIYQKNSGPATARNKAWKSTNADICIFTDGDCEPSADWIEKLLKPFADEKVGATAGAYRTINNESILARFVGHEIAWRYKNVKGEINAHGTYNLAVKKSVLEDVGGLNEEYPRASGEDWDMTYKISKKYKIIFVPEAIVGHHHPETFCWYMKNQARRGYDRIKVYKDHPDMARGDNYTPWYIKYQILAVGAIIPSLILFYPFFKYSYIIPLILILFLFSTSFFSFMYIAKKDIKSALYGIPIQFARNFAWFWGLAKGIIKFGI
jgi:glycosyltransferase involved in cell wall biosynthesis